MKTLFFSLLLLVGAGSAWACSGSANTSAQAGYSLADHQAENYTDSTKHKQCAKACKQKCAGESCKHEKCAKKCKHKDGASGASMQGAIYHPVQASIVATASSTCSYNEGATCTRGCATRNTTAALGGSLLIVLLASELVRRMRL